MRTSTAAVAWTAALAVMSMRGPFTTAEAAPARRAEKEQTRPEIPKLRRRQGFNDTREPGRPDPLGVLNSILPIAESSSSTPADATPIPDSDPSREPPDRDRESSLGSITSSSSIPASSSGPDDGPLDPLLSSLLRPSGDARQPPPSQGASSDDRPDRDPLLGSIADPLSNIVPPTPSDILPTASLPVPLRGTGNNRPEDAEPTGSRGGGGILPGVGDLTSGVLPSGIPRVGTGLPDVLSTLKSDVPPVLPPGGTGNIVSDLPKITGTGGIVPPIASDLPKISGTGGVVPIVSDLPKLPGTGGIVPPIVSDLPKIPGTGGVSPIVSDLPKVTGTGGIIPPIVSDLPKVPGTGGLPIVSDLPKVPGTGGMPIVSDLPKVPGTGGLPIVSDLPKVPGTGGVPIVSDLPKVPGTGGLPIVSDLPKVTGTGGIVPPIVSDLPNLPGTGGLPIVSDLPKATGTGGIVPPIVSDLPKVPGTGGIIPPIVSDLPQLPPTGGLSPVISDLPKITGTGGILPPIRSGIPPVLPPIASGPPTSPGGIIPTSIPDLPSVITSVLSGVTSPVAITVPGGGTTVVASVPQQSASPSGGDPVVTITDSPTAPASTPVASGNENPPPSQPVVPDTNSAAPTAGDTNSAEARPTAPSTPANPPTSVKPTPAASTAPTRPDANSAEPQVSIVATATDSQTSMTLPTSWHFDATSTQTTDKGSDSITTAGNGALPSSSGFPATMPRLVQPAGGMPSPPANATLVQVGFAFGLNYPFVVANPESAAQIFAYLPRGIAHGLGLPEEQVLMNALMPYDTSQTLGYITTLAQTWVPTEMVNPLQLNLHSPGAPIYLNPHAPVRALVNMINPTIGILPGAALDSSSSSLFDPAATNFAGEADGAPIGGDSGSSRKVSGTSVGIGAGAIAGAAVYAAAMIYVARRYRNNRKGHQRASSVPTAGEMTQRSSGGMGTFFMSGANGRSTPRSNLASTGGRGSGVSHGSSNGRSVREQGISAPLMSENSLGWD